MFDRKTEMTVGAFVAIGIAAIIYLAVTLGNVSLIGSKHYSVNALFDSITGLKKGATIEIAGVVVGKVKSISLDEDMALVDMRIIKEVKVTDDTIASVRTKGVIGEKYIRLSLGGADDYIEDGGSIEETESSISIEDLVSKYIFEKEG